MTDNLDRFIDPETRSARIDEAAVIAQQRSGYKLSSEQARVVGEEHIDFVERVVGCIRELKDLSS